MNMWAFKTYTAYILKLAITITITMRTRANLSCPLSGNIEKVKEHTQVNHKGNEVERSPRLKLVGHHAHDYDREARVDPRIGFPLCNTGVDTVLPAHAVGVLLCCRAKRAQDKKIRRARNRSCDWHTSAWVRYASHAKL